MNLAHGLNRAFSTDDCEIMLRNPNCPSKMPAPRVFLGFDPIDPAGSSKQRLVPIILKFVVCSVELVRIHETHLRKTERIESPPERSPMKTFKYFTKLSFL